MSELKRFANTNTLLWMVFLSLLAVLLPHSAYALGRYEPNTAFGQATAWAAAFSFEAAIAVLVHKSAKHAEKTPKGKKGWSKFSYQYLNAYYGGLLLALLVSTLANVAHAVEFGQELKIFAAWGIPSWLYSLAFGAVLPFTSLLFARVLSNVSESEEEGNPELDKANASLRDLGRQLRQSEEQVKQANARFDAAGDLLRALMADDKRERILQARQNWPKLPGASIAILTDTSPAYVSEVLNKV